MTNGHLTKDFSSWLLKHSKMLSPLFSLLNVSSGFLLRLWNKPIVFLKMGQSRPLLVYFRSFHIPIQMTNKNWKKHRWCAWDSNPGGQDGRCRRIHWAMAAPLQINCLLKKYSSPNLNDTIEGKISSSYLKRLTTLGIHYLSDKGIISEHQLRKLIKNMFRHICLLDLLNSDLDVRLSLLGNSQSQ